MTSINLLTAATINGVGAAVPSGALTGTLRRGPVTIYAVGVFGGATVTIEASPDGVNFILIPGVTLSATLQAANLDMAASHLRATVADATGTTNLNVIAI